MKLIGYIVTNNISVVYNTKEEAENAYNKELDSLSGMERNTFEFLYSVAPMYDNHSLVI